MGYAGSSSEASVGRLKRPRVDAGVGLDGSSNCTAAERRGAVNLSLCEAIKTSRNSIPENIKLWLEHCEKDERDLEAAVVDLLTMLSEACRTEYAINGPPFEVDAEGVVAAHRIDQDESEDPEKIMPNNLKENLFYFWKDLVTQWHKGLIFDDDLLTMCVHNVISLSRTSANIFGASLLGLQLFKSMIPVAVELELQLEAAEKNKQAGGSHVEESPKRHSLMRVIPMMRDLFKRFIHPDVYPNIRISWIHSFKSWTIAHPNLFLRLSFLHYLYCVLDDKDASVRKASVLALLCLAVTDEYMDCRRNFARTVFSPKLTALVDDVDATVANCALEVFVQFLRHKLLTDLNIGSFSEANKHPLIKDIAEKLVNDYWNAQSFIPEQCSKDVVEISRLLKVLRKLSPDMMDFAINNYWVYLRGIQDYELIISVLVADNPPLELTVNDSTNLIHLLFFCVRKTVGESIFPVIEEKKSLRYKKREITSAVMELYPQLLLKFKDDGTNIPVLVEIIRCMDLNLYSLHSKEKFFQKVLELIRIVFFQHVDDKTMESCAEALNYCQENIKISKLLTLVTSMLNELGNELITRLQKDAEGDEEDDFIVDMKRVYHLEMGSISIYHIRSEVVKLCDEMDSPTISKIVKKGVECAFTSNLYFSKYGVLHHFISKLPWNEALEILTDARARIGDKFKAGSYVWRAYFDLLDKSED